MPEDAKRAVYGTSTVKRDRRTRAQLDAVDQAILTVLEDENPATVRSVFYRVTSMGLAPKTENGYRLIGRQLLKLRRAGRVPYAYITDGTRYVVQAETHSSAGRALAMTAKYYRREVWMNQPVRVNIFSEKDALTGVISPITNKWDVPLGVMRGYPSESFVYEIAEALPVDATTYMYQLGDHDPSGVDAWRSFEAKVREFNPHADVRFERIAVTPDQILEMGLQTRPTKTKDTRSKSFIGGSVEVDAIAPSVLRSMVEDSIVQHLDWAAYQALKRIEAEEIEQLQNIASDPRLSMIGGL